MTNESPLITEYENNRNIILTGGAGVGKTFHSNMLRMKHGQDIAFTATTGLASTHVCGTTIHRFTGMGVFGMDDLSKIVKSNGFRRFVTIAREHIKAIVIDEVSMMRSDNFSVLNKICKIARENDEPFGGLQLICVGDFLQLPPVVKRDEFFDKLFIFQTDDFLEANFKVINLTEVKRQNDPEFINALNDIRLGGCSLETDKLLRDRSDLEFTDVIPVKLFARLNEVELYNKNKLNMLETPSYYSNSRISSTAPEFYYQLKEQVEGLEDLEFKVGAKVMTIVNNPEMGFSNGTTGTIVDIQNKVHPYLNNPDLGESKQIVLVVELDNGEGTIEIGKQQWSIDCPEGTLNKTGNGPLKVAKFIQYPVKLAWAISVHKSQGMSLDYVDFDCNKVFGHGMIYVGLSRAKTIDGLVLQNWKPSRISADPIAVNFYKGFIQ